MSLRRREKLESVEEDSSVRGKGRAKTSRHLGFKKGGKIVTRVKVFANGRRVVEGKGRRYDGARQGRLPVRKVCRKGGTSRKGGEERREKPGCVRDGFKDGRKYENPRSINRQIDRGESVIENDREAAKGALRRGREPGKR